MVDEDLYYIQNTLNQADCMLFWRPNGRGYTFNLDDAWKLPKDRALQICRNRPEQDIPRPAAEVEAQAVRHVPR